jgi:hypothetical protein
MWTHPPAPRPTGTQVPTLDGPSTVSPSCPDDTLPYTLRLLPGVVFATNDSAYSMSGCVTLGPPPAPLPPPLASLTTPLRLVPSCGSVFLDATGSMSRDGRTPWLQWSAVGTNAAGVSPWRGAGSFVGACPIGYRN